MAPPTAPTASSICTEALTRFLDGGTPESAEVTRATNYGLEKVKRDIMLLGKTWRPLIKTAYQITAANQARYDNPADWGADLSVGLMTGLHSSTLSAVASASSVTLAVAEDATAIEAQGKWLLITGADGSIQAQQIKSYTFATKVAIMAEAYAVLPVIGDAYLLVNSIKELTPLVEQFYNLLSTEGTAGTPVRYSPKKNGTIGEIALHPIPAGGYGLRRLYYADLMLLDITEGATTLYTTILTRWASVLEQGVYVWKLGEDDDRYERENGLYQDMLIALMAADLDGYVPESKKAGGQ